MLIRSILSFYMDRKIICVSFRKHLKIKTNSVLFYAYSINISQYLTKLFFDIARSHYVNLRPFADQI